MTIYDKLFPLGIGTNRFPVTGPNDEVGIDQAAQVMALALKSGVSYIDVAHTYSKGAAMQICRRAFAQTNMFRCVTVKSSFLSDKTADDALRRTEAAFVSMGIDHAFCFVIWNISSYEQFKKIMKHNSLYDGARLAQERRLVDHICFSTHAPPGDIIKMLHSGAFEGVTLSFSVLNSQIIKPVLDCAAEQNIGVVVMNPLGGGLIPQQSDFFSFLRGSDDTSTTQAALRYVCTHPAVKIVLSGMSTKTEVRENLSAFQTPVAEVPEERIARVNRSFQSVEGFCTGCRYCEGCPRGIDIFALMQSYNTTLFPQSQTSYGRTDAGLIETIGICSRLKNTFGFLPPNTENPCIKCGRCEMRCTAHLPIMERIEKLYQRFSEAGFSKCSMLERLQHLIGNRKRIAFYPSGGYTAYVLELLKEAFPEATLQLSLFDSNPKLWGTTTAGIEVQGPEDIIKASPECVIVSNYNYSDEIYSDLAHRLMGNIPIVKLHGSDDVPWVF